MQTRPLKKFVLKIFLGKRWKYYTETELNVLFTNFIFQRLLGINKQTPFSVHFTSRVVIYEKIEHQYDKLTLSSFANSHGSYIQAINGIKIGSNFLFGPGLRLISANHDPNRLDSWEKIQPIEIGDNVWMGSNVTVLPGVKIPANTVVGAGAVLTKTFEEENTVLAGNPAKVIRKK
jgi:acetyltransferase-like isoleucine patch superfamily enzyme